MRTRWMFFAVILLIFQVMTLFGGVKTMTGPILMPIPASIKMTSDKFVLSDSFSVAISGHASPRLQHATTRTMARLARLTGLFLPRDLIINNDPKTDQASLIVHCQRPGKLALHENESYRLLVTNRTIELSAETDLGVLRGLETLLQLVMADSNAYYLPGVEIEDAPRFVWRGLLIDVGRHFMPVDVIKRNLDGMAAVKMNVLHWHLTEDQGFRVECKTFPKLHELGSDGFYYTHEQIKEVIAYAAERGIRVVPEFDMPGHATSWFVGYPELASAPGPYQIKRTWGIHDPVMDPTRESTYQFLDKFFKEMATLFPDEYIHIGGDENNGKQWSANPHIQAFMKKHNFRTTAELQGHFNRRIHKILGKYGKKMVGWDEIFESELPKDIVIQSWRGRESLYEAARKGYRCLLSNGYYIDLIQPTDYHYLNDPLPSDAPISESERSFILGGEATMWSEFVCAETIDSRIWPRTAAIAERLWSPEHIRDVEDMYRRLETMSFRLEHLGLTHDKNYLMMLRRLANNTDFSPLKTLVDVIEPVKIYTRGQLRQYTSFSPLTRVVDAARPDAKVARLFRNRVDSLLANPSSANGLWQAIKNDLVLWQNNHELLKPIIAGSPILREIESLSYDLSQLATVGLQAIHYLETGQLADRTWKANSLQIANQAKTPRGETELMIISAIEKLINQAARDTN
ncbi:MAG: family 20 glycosylhydrolase [candidate division KSB1 bacterium]|nr:family 20 glycosylhydrolase [candidate division KSB1 bacterium]MDZ7358622.1 family 20 glycosylhydrolase [candidate division KSB1 bacterium]